MVDGTDTLLRGCPHCGLVHRMPAFAEGLAGMEARCVRCGGVLYRPGASDATRLCASLAAAALICYPLGVGLPVITLEQFGHVHQTSIWAGSLAMLAAGQWFVGLVVLVCSVVIPLAKLAGLLVLTLQPGLLYRHHRARLHRWIELAGRWGMIDVLLVAVLVAALKLGDLVSVQPGPGAVAFTACVVLSLAASAAFSPQAIWEGPA